VLNVLLVPVNDLISHPIETRFISIAKKMTEKFSVNISVLRYTNIPTSSRACGVERKLGFKSVKFKDFKTGNIGLYYVVNAIPIFSTLLNQLKNENFDIIIHANILPSTIAVELGKMFHKPLIFDFQDYFPESASSYFKGNLLKSLTYSLTSQITRFNVKHSDAVVTVTNAHKEKIKEYEPLKFVKVIPNGVDTDLFRPIPKAEALKKLNMEELGEKIILIYYGSIDPWLDFSAVFRVIKRLVKKGFDILLFIIGFCHSGYYLEEIREAAESVGIGKRVFIFDPVPQNRLVYYINASDITLVPYKPTLKNQAVPLKVLESIACRKFVCVTKLPEIIERFSDVVDTYSSEDELEYSLLKYIKGEVQVSADRIREIVKQYSWNNIASSYCDLITQLINKRGVM
jgi:glycosyltransferase involved in cell wall biosynthesis